MSSSSDRGIGLADLVDAVARGGWPALQKMPIEGAIASVADYLEEVTRTDIGRLDGVRRDPARVRRLLRSLARNVATHVTITKLAAETADPGSRPAQEPDRERLPDRARAPLRGRGPTTLAAAPAIALDPAQIGQAPLR